MAEYSKINIVYRLQRWMDSVPGQTFLNYAYSWGASVVILGTLFKLTHLPGANIMLFAGMGTEVVVFFLSAFDRPFDKTAEGRNLPTHVTEEYLSGETAGEEENERTATTPASETPVAATSTVASTAVPHPQPSPTAAAVTAMPSYVPQMSAEEAEEFKEAQSQYVGELKQLVETLGKVNEQSMRLTRDSEEMENLNRTLTGISRIYEMQLKGASRQIDTIDRINEQSRKMAGLIEQLNEIYARMIKAMTVNGQPVRQSGETPAV